MEEAEKGTEQLERGLPQDWESTEEKWGGQESGKHKQGRRTDRGCSPEGWETQERFQDLERLQLSPVPRESQR